MRRPRLAAGLLLVAALAIGTLGSTGANAHVAGNHFVNGAGVAGMNMVTVTGADQALDIGAATVGLTNITLSCVFVMSSSSAGTHLAAMYGTGGGLQWTITIRESTTGDFLIVNNTPTSGVPTDANMCGIGNVGATGTGAFVI